MSQLLKITDPTLADVFLSRPQNANLTPISDTFSSILNEFAAKTEPTTYNQISLEQLTMSTLNTPEVQRNGAMIR